MGIDYRVMATYGTPVSQELMDELAKEVLTEEQIEQGFAYDLPYEFNQYFGLDCDTYGDQMNGEVEYIVGHSCFNWNMRYDEGAYKALELDPGGDQEKLREFVKKYNLVTPRWYAGMSVS